MKTLSSYELILGQNIRISAIANIQICCIRNSRVSWVLIQIITSSCISCVEFACSPCACVGFLWVLRFPPTQPKTCGYVIKDSALTTGVNMNAAACLYTADLRLTRRPRVSPASPEQPRNRIIGWRDSYCILRRLVFNLKKGLCKCTSWFGGVEADSLCLQLMWRSCGIRYKLQTCRLLFACDATLWRLSCPLHLKVKRQQHTASISLGENKKPNSWYRATTWVSPDMGLY